MFKGILDKTSCLKKHPPHIRAVTTPPPPHHFNSLYLQSNIIIPLFIEGLPWKMKRRPRNNCSKK